ncbi:unnamed protein product [Caenorhabditis bovis]|uniref:glutathione transferase n=1 Tax=Caenorhabditis bovis TaxID=2654633 RepID=A0A8S1EXX0_9PELO|nr:unnamed protein product [Caenorhabditis bovis]
MPSYKLTYFPSRGLAEVSRQLFVLAGVEFEDEKLDFDQFSKQKPTLPFGQVPVLTIDGLTEIPQSVAIARYLARKFGYAGKTPEEEAWVDALADQFKDFYAEIRTYFYSKLGFLPNDIEEELTKTLIPARDKYLGVLEKVLKNSKSGFLVGNDITYADLMIVDNMTTLIGWYPEFTEGFPLVQQHRNRVTNYPKLKEYLETRPVTNT